MQTRLSGASRWSALETILGGGFFKRNYGEFSTGVDTSCGLVPRVFVNRGNYLFCSPILGEANPSPGVEKTKSLKAELMAALHEAFTYADRAYEALTEDNMNDMVQAFGGERIRLGVLWFNTSHNLEHYGSIAVYLRLKGIVPPNSESGPR